MNTDIDINDIRLTKQKIRSKILFKLKTQEEEGRKRKSKIIKEKLFKTQVFRKAKRIMFYISFGGEVNTKEMIKEALRAGKRIAVPVCRKNRVIKPCLLGKNARLKEGLYGIGEPVMKKFIRLQDIDLIVVPGVAFDKEGRRLGRGKGYYDRFLKRVPGNTASIGLAFDFQILPALPTTKTDVSVNKVIFA